MPGPHPTDRTLAALVDGRLDHGTAAAAREHISDCARCQLRTGAAGEAILPVRRREIEPVPIPLVEDSAAKVPAAGDIWRLAWDATVVLTIIWRVEADRVAVLPVVETADADDWCALLDRTGTGGLGDLAVSVAQETTVPWAVLDARVGQLGDIRDLAELRAAFRTGAATTASRGEPVRSPLDERLVGLDEVTERLAELANAVWAPPVAAAAVLALDFDTLLAAGLPVPRALAISTRGAAPTDDEADAIEAATGIRPAPQPIDEDLRRKIDQPRRKAAIRARARANRRTEAAERLAIAHDAQPARAAARGTRGAAPDFDTILDRLLDA
jgi:hypothetical protein